MRWLIAGIVAIGAGACDVQGDVPQDTREHDARFVGDWAVDQPYHALYEGTVYAFDRDGELRVVESVTLGAPADDYVTGTVSDASRTVRCTFGDRWHSLDDATLVVASACDDGGQREVTLGFSADAAGNAVDAGVEVVAVDGETGWFHDDFEWRWRKCPASGDCLMMF